MCHHTLEIGLPAVQAKFGQSGVCYAGLSEGVRHARILHFFRELPVDGYRVRAYVAPTLRQAVERTA